MKPGDIVFYEDKRFGRHRFYRILGCFHGATGQTSVIELESLTEQPPYVGGVDAPVRMYVPEPLLRGVPIYLLADSTT